MWRLCLPACLEWAGTRQTPNTRRTEKSISKTNNQKSVWKLISVYNKNSLTSCRKIPIHPKYMSNKDSLPVPVKIAVKIWDVLEDLQWAVLCQTSSPPYIFSVMLWSLALWGCPGEATVKRSSFFLLSALKETHFSYQLLFLERIRIILDWTYFKKLYDKQQNKCY